MPALLVLLACLGQLSAPQLAESGASIAVVAELAEFDSAQRTLRAEGQVSLVSGGLRLFTETLEYDLAKRAGDVEGGLLLLDGDLVVAAHQGTFSLGEEGVFALDDVELWQKAPGVQLLDVRDPAAARRIGRNLLLLKAEHLERVAQGRLLARRLRMTACDCGVEASPDWSISASEADIEPGERAILWWPAFYVKSIPVFALPALYVPLSSRRTGLLFPRPGYSSRNGFVVDEPFFWAIDPSHDLTLGLGWVFGSAPATIADRAGARGPRGSAELRYAPAESTSGRFLVGGVYDLNREPSPSSPLRRGPRGELTFRHSTALDNGVGAQADLRLVSDANYPIDHSVDTIREAPAYLRSEAWSGWRGSAMALTLSTAWYQDRTAWNPDRQLASSAPERWFFGANAPAGLERPLAFTLSVPRATLVGPLRAGIEIAAARLQPVSLLAGEAPASLLTLTRLDATPSLSWAVLGRGPIHAELSASARGDLASYSGVPGGQRSAVHGRVSAGAWMGTELSRTFLDGTLKHTLEPRIELRAASQRLGDDPSLATELVAPVDEFDELGSAYVQGIAALSMRLARRGAGELARLEVGQDVDLLAARAADSFARLEVAPRYVQLSAVGRWDWQRKAVSSLSAALRGNDSRGDSLELRYDRLLAGGTARMRAALDALFGSELAQKGDDGGFNQVGLGLNLRVLQGITFRYGAIMLPDQPRSFLERLVRHTVGVGLATSCDCWRVDLYGFYDRNTGFDFGFLVDLKSLGSVGR
ncbi:MAG: LPS assembly protein LptD [Deltaproteobacteria bacterium]|nr:LPS assembly protein LptD [Deltaproteobacteria bacterium]